MGQLCTFDTYESNCEITRDRRKEIKTSATLVQSKWSGTQVTQQLNMTTSLRVSTHAPIKNLNMKPVKELPNYLNQITKNVYAQLGEFNYEKYKIPNNTRYPVLAPAEDRETNSFYLGQWQYGLRIGRGKCVWKDGSIYEGEWKDDMSNGYGRLIHANGAVYEGQFENNMAHGHGEYSHPDGNKYIGEWFNDAQHGKGKEIFPDGSVFTGKFNMGQKEGQGYFKWKNGSTYKGKFDDNKMEGMGTYTYPDGRKYVGQ